MIDRFIQKEIKDLIDEYYENCKRDHKILYNACLRALKEATMNIDCGTHVAIWHTSLRSSNQPCTVLGLIEMLYKKRE